MAFLKALVARDALREPGEPLPSCAELLKAVDQSFPQPRWLLPAMSEMDIARLFSPVVALAARWPLDRLAALVIGVRIHLPNTPEAYSIATQVFAAGVRRLQAAHGPHAPAQTSAPGRLRAAAAALAMIEALVRKAHPLGLDSSRQAQRDHRWLALDELLPALKAISYFPSPEDGSGPESPAALCRRTGKYLSRLTPACDRLDAVRAGAELAMTMGAGPLAPDSIDALVRAWVAHEDRNEDSCRQIDRRAAFLRGVLLARDDMAAVPMLAHILGPRPPRAGDSDSTLNTVQLVEALGRAVCIERSTLDDFAEWSVQLFPGRGAGVDSKAAAFPPASLGAAMVASMRLAGGTAAPPDRMAVMLEAVIRRYADPADEAALVSALASAAWAADADPLHSRSLQAAVRRLATPDQALAPARLGRIAMLLGRQFSPANALPWLIRAGHQLDVAA